MMTIEEAIKTALEYETRIRDIYKEACAIVDDAAGRRILTMLKDDEENHIAYLESRLELWQKTGTLSAEKLKSIIPPADEIRKKTDKVATHMPEQPKTGEQDILSRALKAEIETSRFYQQMVDEMSGEGQQLFAHFLEIEENHIAAVQFELDYVMNSGYWFDFKEFDMEDF
jgi:rubrerythrin